MRVSVLINERAGSVNADFIEGKIRESLFRCDLRIARPKTHPELADFLAEEIVRNTDGFIICGGDGTINATLQHLMALRLSEKMPPIAVVRSGTANDLAQEIGISNRIDIAIRSIFEGYVRHIDVIEVAAEGTTKYMLTNGGLGLPAVAAELANKFRSHLRSLAEKADRGAFRFLAEKSYHAVKKMGPSVYSLMTAEAIRTWNNEGWGLEVSLPAQESFLTDSPIVLVNNQTSIGSNFSPAPYTSNTDGTVNLLLSETNSVSAHTLAAMHIRRGTVDKFAPIKTFELKEFKLKTQNPSRLLTFFGDGEILHRDVQEISVRCIHRALPLMVRQ